MFNKHFSILFLGGLLAIVAIGRVTGQEAERAGVQSPSQPAGAKNQSGKAVADKMMGNRKLNPVKPTGGIKSPNQLAPGGGKLDPRIVGVAPGGTQPQLKPEGTFIVERMGRIARSQDGVHQLFIFNGDSKESPEPPMVVMPCKMLEAMEKVIRERGDQTVFKLSGQVFIYHGANYVLPTVMRVAHVKDNLK